MPTLAILLALLLPVATSSDDDARAGYVPSGSLVDLHDLGRLARLRDPGVRPLAFSSFDRQGGNDDGFNGTYSRLREEQGNSVLAECKGPGIIERIWFTHSVAKEPGLLDRKGEHLRIYLDGKSSPALDLPLEALFQGAHPRFPKPLVSEGSGGFVCYVPIPFRDGCKVVVDGLGVRFYQINLLSQPSSKGVESFTEEISSSERPQLDQAVRVWSSPGDLDALAIDRSEQAEYVVDLIPRASATFELPGGPRTLRSLEVIPAAGTSDAWRSARLRLSWDTEIAGPAGVDLPLGYAFGQALGSAPYQSVLIGQNGEAWYLRFPMPYRQRGTLRIDTMRRIKGSLRVVSVPGADANAGYFRAHYVEALPTRKGVDFPLLAAKGRGHYAGTFLATEGHTHLPLWLEGDDHFEVDGQSAIHGTGTEDYFNGGWYALKGRLDRP
ncbi:MAG TPA: DUF2961 domain-containing protein, partial [Isosphaeraceae bacterium]|nr:DUF2961 domain-containing protein [Isosphaeraceae bacterium]